MIKVYILMLKKQFGEREKKQKKKKQKSQEKSQKRKLERESRIII